MDAKSEIIWLSLGSNEGDRKDNLFRALNLLKKHPKIEVLQNSFILENPAMLYLEQADFLNQIVSCTSTLTPLEMLDTLQEMEVQLGRVYRFENGPREIDLDILSFGNRIIQNKRLTIPHPGLIDRPYLKTLFENLGIDVDTLT